MSTLERAIAMAAEAHAGQLDKGGQPYILHPLRVMAAMQTIDDMIVAVLHDTLEDNPFLRPHMISAKGFAPHVVEAICNLTRWDGLSYAEYLSRVARNPITRRVKIEDLKDNMRLERLPQPITPADEKRQAKYAAALAVLENSNG